MKLTILAAALTTALATAADKCSFAIPFRNDSEKIYASTAVGNDDPGRLLKIVIGSSNLWQLNVGGNVYRSPFLENATTKTIQIEERVYGNDIFISSDVASAKDPIDFNVVAYLDNVAIPGWKFTDQVQSSSGWWYKLNGAASWGTSYGNALSVSQKCTKASRVHSDPSCYTHRYFRLDVPNAVPGASSSVAQSEQSQVIVKAEEVKQEENKSNGTTAGTLGAVGATCVGAAAIFMYRRRSIVQRGAPEPAAFSDNNNMNPLYENKTANENPLYASPDQHVEDGFSDERDLA